MQIKLDYKMCLGLYVIIIKFFHDGGVIGYMNGVYKKKRKTILKTAKSLRVNEVSNQFLSLLLPLL